MQALRMHLRVADHESGNRRSGFFADAVGIPREDPHVHDIEWNFNGIDDGASRYAWVDCKLKCNGSIWKMGIKKIANDMRKQKGWDVAVSKGYGSHGDEYSIPVRRNSLK